MEERRQSDRVEAPRVLLRIASLERLRQHYLKDLSEGGAFIRIANPMPVGSALLVDIEWPGVEESLRLAAKVIRVIKPNEAAPGQAVGMGVKFDGADPAMLGRLKKLCEQYQPGSPDADEKTRLRGQIQGLIIELGATREALAKAERQTSEAETRAQNAAREAQDAAARAMSLEGKSDESSAQAAKIAQLEKRVAELSNELREKMSAAAELRMELEEAKGKIAAFEDQIQTIEQDEASARTLAERLAAEKMRIERVHREDSARYSAETGGLKSELETARAQMAMTQKSSEEATRRSTEEVEKARSMFQVALKERLALEEADRKRIEAERDQAKKQADEAVAELEKLRKANFDREEAQAAQSRQIASLGRRLADTERDLERSKKRERDLSRLLAAVSAGEAPADEVVVVTQESASPESKATSEIKDKDIVSEQRVDAIPAPKTGIALETKLEAGSMPASIPEAETVEEVDIDD
jgi:Tfp pilus assembly protein PilZ